MKYFAVILFFLNIWAIHCKIINHVKAYKVDCTFSEAYFINGTCSLKPVNRFSSAFSLYAYLKKPIDNFTTTAKLFRRYNTFEPFLVNLKLKFCDYLSGMRKSYVFSIAKTFLNKYTNVNHSCPLSGAIIAKDVEFIPEIARNAPSILPEGIYRLDIHAFQDIEKNSIALGRAYIEVKERDDRM